MSLAVLLCAGAIGSGLWTGTIVGQSSTHASADQYEQAVLPVLAANCFSCHSDRIHTANLSLEALRDPSPPLFRNVLPGPKGS